MEIEEARDRVNDMINRWDSTPEWHDPEFTDGLIKIDTGDLLAIKIVTSTYPS